MSTTPRGDGPAVFISYRVADTRLHADRLAKELKQTFGAETIFFDSRTIDPGDPWETRIQSALESACVVLVLIGKRWLFAQDEDGTRRLDLPGDWVRREIETALLGEAVVIPVLVDCDSLPRKEAFDRLPSIKGLLGYQSKRLRIDDWESDFDVLVTVLEERGCERVISVDPQPLETTVRWNVERDGSPYPGLLHFTPYHAPVFFGREAEIHELFGRLQHPDNRFLVVSGGSGSGKSSLVHAGLLPYLEKMGLPGKETVTAVRMLPSWLPNCFGALMRALSPHLEQAGLNEAEATTDLTTHPNTLADWLHDISAGMPPTTGLLLFIDQMEELFAAGSADQHLSRPFLDGLYEATRRGDLCAVTTIRNDQLQPLYDHPLLVTVLNSPAHYCLGTLTPQGLQDTIARPARAAGVEVPPGLVSKLVTDIGQEPGSLPLLAFALHRLFEQAQDGAMSENLYETWGGDDLGRLAGAIAEHAEQAETRLAKKLKLGRQALQERLSSVFSKLVRVDVEGIPLRLRAPVAMMPADHRQVVSDLASEKVRFLATDTDRVEGAMSGVRQIVSIAHEKLLSAWPSLNQWVEDNRSDLISLRRAEVDAQEWKANRWELDLLWSPERLLILREIMENFPGLVASDELNRFIHPQETLVHRLADQDLSQSDRQTIGRYLSKLGDVRAGVGVCDDGLPDIEWLEVKGDWVEPEGKACEGYAESFEIARYPITNSQFQSFVDSEDGYSNQRWWKGMAAKANNGPLPSRWTEPNTPRETLSWYEANAFCRWLSSRTGFQVSLPTFAQWLQAASCGRAFQDYPWGNRWNSNYCNSAEAGINRTTVVGLYPSDPCLGDTAPRDMVGNVWEWCLDKHDDKSDTLKHYPGDWRIMCGGAWGNSSDMLRLGRQFGDDASLRADYVGFRPIRAR